MLETLLHTKLLVPPLRSNLVNRPDLIKRLNQGLQFGVTLTLVSAPAGFGKTTLVVAWLNQQTNPVAWVSLDKNDDDPHRFLRYLIAGCQTGLPDFDLDLMRLLDLPAQDLHWQRVLTTVINEIATFSSQLILVLDDYQHMQSSTIQEMLVFLLGHQPPNLHMVMITRTVPNLPLPRLRAQGQINELDLEDLRFTTEEIEHFFHRLTLPDLSESDLVLLTERTEGWPAGLQLAAVAMQAALRSSSSEPSQFVASFSGSNRLVLDYLVDEVLAQQPKRTKDFLIHTSILERLCAPLCAALLAGEPGDVAYQQKMLEQLDDANLFIMPLDQERRWYRYHPLFGDLLRDRLQQTMPGQIPVLHGRASRWFAENGTISEAVAHAFAADDETAVSRLIVDNAPDLIRRGEVVELARWLQKLPAAVRLTHPRLDLYLVMAQLLSGEFINLTEIVTRLDRVVGRLQMTGSPELERFLAEANAIRAALLVEEGDTEAGLRLAEPAAAELAQDGSPYGRYLQAVLAATRGLAYRDQGKTEMAAVAYASAAGNQDNPATFLLATYEQGILLQEMGQLRRAEQIHRDSLVWGKEQFGVGAAAIPLTGAAYIGLGKLLYERNRLNEAGEHLEKGIVLAGQRGGLGIDRDGLLALAFVRQAQGSSIEASERMAQAVAHARQSPRADARLRVEARQAHLWLMQGHRTPAVQWAEKQTIDANNTAYPAEITGVSLAHIYLSHGQTERALALLDAFFPVVKEGGRNGRLLEMWLLKAVAHHQRNKALLALEALARCLETAGRENYVRVFLDMGQLLQPLLYTAVEQDLMPDLSGQLLSLLTAQPYFPDNDGLHTATSGLIEPLSEREIEVLELVAEGLTNREVGLRLHLSPNTIKRHTLNIYEKLGVHNRTEAVNKARRFGIIP